MSLDIQVVSDLHLEFRADKKPFNLFKPTAPILALLGDICCVGDISDFEIFKRFMLEILPNYEHCIMISGNHEPYYNPIKKSTPPTKDNTLDACSAKIKAFFRATSKKLHYLDNNTLKLTVGKKKYVIVGSTLWSHIPKEEQTRVQDIMSDYQYVYVKDQKTAKIRKLLASDVQQMFSKNYKYIKTQVDKAIAGNYKVIIMTHHCPFIYKTYDPKSFDVAYYSDCSAIANPKAVAMWLYGHTHQALDKVIGKVRYYSNPLGYPRERTGFDKDAKVKICI